jgi:hypothetical protein
VQLGRQWWSCWCSSLVTSVWELILNLIFGFKNG